MSGVSDARVMKSYIPTARVAVRCGLVTFEGGWGRWGKIGGAGEAVMGIKKRAEPGGTPDRSRTYDTQLRKLVLYPLSYGRI